MALQQRLKLVLDRLVCSHWNKGTRSSSRRWHRAARAAAMAAAAACAPPRTGVLGSRCTSACGLDVSRWFESLTTRFRAMWQLWACSRAPIVPYVLSVTFFRARHLSLFSSTISPHHRPPSPHTQPYPIPGDSARCTMSLHTIPGRMGPQSASRRHQPMNQRMGLSGAIQPAVVTQARCRCVQRPASTAAGAFGPSTAAPTNAACAAAAAVASQCAQRCVAARACRAGPPGAAAVPPAAVSDPTPALTGSRQQGASAGAAWSRAQQRGVGVWERLAHSSGSTTR